MNSSCSRPLCLSMPPAVLHSVLDWFSCRRILLLRHNTLNKHRRMTATAKWQNLRFYYLPQGLRGLTSTTCCHAAILCDLNFIKHISRFLTIIRFVLSLAFQRPIPNCDTAKTRKDTAKRMRKAEVLRNPAFSMFLWDLPEITSRRLHSKTMW